MSREQQSKLYQKYETKLQRKCELIGKYKDLPILKMVKENP